MPDPRRDRSKTRPAATRGQDDDLKKTLIPPMLVMAVLMFLLGGWAVAALCGHNLLTDEPSATADRMAKVMLLCWPVGVLLAAGIFLFRRDLKRSRRNDA